MLCYPSVAGQYSEGRLPVSATSGSRSKGEDTCESPETTACSVQEVKNMAKKKKAGETAAKPKKSDAPPRVKKDSEEVSLAELTPAKLRKRHRKGNVRHTLVLEADMTETQIRKALNLGDRTRRLGDRLVADLQPRIKQMRRTIEYQTAYGAYAAVAKEVAEMSEADPDYDAKVLEKEALWEPVEEILEKWNITESYAINFTQNLRKEYGVPSFFSQTRTDAIWAGVKTVLYRGGHQLHVKSHDDIPELAAKEAGRGISFHVKDGKLEFTMNLPASRSYLNSELEKKVAKIQKERSAGLPEGARAPELSQKEKDDLRHSMKLSLMEPNRFGVKVKKGDLFAEEELAHLIAFLEDPDAEKKALDEYVRTGKKQETFRPCYATLCFERIRGKNRVFVHIALEAVPLPKRRKDGSFRHTLGRGRVAGDLGPQSLVSYSHGKLVMENIGEIKPNATFRTERREKILLRSMDRSRRAMNPKYYNPNGTIKRGRKNWKKSRHYLRMLDEYRDICRKNAINRKLANQRIAHHRRARGDEYITEPNNTQQMIASSRKKKKGPKKKPGTVRWSKEKKAEAAATAKQTSQNSPASNPSGGQAASAPSSAKASSDGKQSARAKTRARARVRVKTEAKDKARVKDKAEAEVRDAESRTPASQPASPEPADPHKHKHSGRKKGRFRFTRSIQNRCPGGLFAEIKRVFTSTGGSFRVVPNNYSATQYNHMTGTKVKRELGDRMFQLDPKDPKTIVQRDGHSAFNMYCAKDDLSEPDRLRCQEEFKAYLEAQQQEIERIQQNHIKVCNSGIQV